MNFWDYLIIRPIEHTFAIELYDLPNMPKIIQFLRSIVMSQWMNSKDYEFSQRSGAFVQGWSGNWVLIEFWRDDGAESFLDYCNAKWANENH